MVSFLFCIIQVYCTVIPIFFERGSSNDNKEAFRHWYGKLAELRALLTSNTPVCAMTATATSTVKAQVINSLEMDQPVCIEDSPAKDNIKYCVIDAPTSKLDVSFGWIVNELIEKSNLCTKYLIFCRSRKVVRDLYSLFHDELGEKQYVQSDTGENTYRNRIFAMYHSRTHRDVKSTVQSSFAAENGTVRVLIATIAYGMGINVKDLHTVIHYGPADDLDDYVQESGRVGRDGQQSYAILIKYKKCLSGSRISTAMKDYITAKVGECRRVKLYSVFPFSVKPHKTPHLCCDICESTCDCVECVDKQIFWSHAQVCLHAAYKDLSGKKDVKTFSREVSDIEKARIYDEILKYRQEIIDSGNPGNVKLYVGEDIATGMPLSTIQRIVDTCDIITGADHLWLNYGIFDKTHSDKIWEILDCNICAPLIESDLCGIVGDLDILSGISDEEDDDETNTGRRKQSVIVSRRGSSSSSGWGSD